VYETTTCSPRAVRAAAGAGEDSSTGSGPGEPDDAQQGSLVNVQGATKVKAKLKQAMYSEKIKLPPMDSTWGDARDSMVEKLLSMASKLGIYVDPEHTDERTVLVWNHVLVVNDDSKTDQGEPLTYGAVLHRLRLYWGPLSAKEGSNRKVLTADMQLAMLRESKRCTLYIISSF
jgi:hypothetical protein